MGALKSVEIVHNGIVTEWKLSRVNVLIGENGSGKTRLLTKIHHAVKDEHSLLPESQKNINSIQLRLHWKSYLKKEKRNSVFIHPSLFLQQSSPCSLFADQSTENSELENFREVISSFFWDKDKRFVLSNKQIKVLTGHNKIPLNQLSSGEQHLLSLLWQCLCAKPHSIILIDDPELHLHLGWQHQLITKILEVSPSDSQLIISTHSPGIISKGWKDAVTKIETLFKNS